MANKIVYIAHYEEPNQPPKRISSPAACGKIDYVLSVLNTLQKETLVISAGGTKGKENVKSDIVQKGEFVKIKFFSGLGWKNGFEKIISRALHNIKLCAYAFKNVKKNDTVIVYHSIALINVIKFLRFFKKFRLIIEAEEIYGDVMQNEKVSGKERRFFETANAFIFPTELLNEDINRNNKPVAVIYGTYNVEKKLSDEFSDSKIHCVYGGTLDPRKGGAAAAVAAGEYLDSNYHIHILGFGSDADKEALLKEAERISNAGGATVTFEGCLFGEDYVRFIQKCHIGFSTQNPEAAFNDTSFPSKILMYMSNGLRVVSVKIPAIEKSQVGSHMYYYDEQTPQQIADAVKAVDFSDGYNGRAVVEELHKSFVEKIREFLENAQ